MKKFLVAAISALGMGSSQGSPPEPPATPDYSQVTTIEAAQKLVREGKLFKILLFPEEFGGEDNSLNAVYVPAGIPEVKDQITQTLIKYYNEDQIDSLTVNPEYKGESIVPSKIIMVAKHSTKTGTFEPAIDIW